ncbi:MAG: adenine deaminase [Phycisphaerales bacterium]|nr:adenine deaminase [Phycisphaerales bacterium]MCB9863128.1 adenine deaminase [Phycisphaerales bacterium]
MSTTAELKQRVDVAAGRSPADLVLRGGRIVNVLSNEIHEGDIAIVGDRIVGIGRYDGHVVEDVSGMYICPGLIDAHVHIESSMLAPPAFARLVSACGTTAVVTDPHEIANVLGVDGIRYMLAASENCPLDVYAMLSSCVPASHLESAGTTLAANDLQPLFANPRVLGLAEMMNFPGVVSGDAACLEKIAMTRGRVDGHAPGLGGRDLCAYVSTGIASDHECTTVDEAREKLRLGLQIMIREGSQARNLAALLPLVSTATADRFMFCTDDKDVDDLLAEGQIDYMIRTAIASGLDPILAVRLGSYTASRYFGLNDLGAIAPSRRACLTLVDDLTAFRVRRVYHNGKLVAADGKSTVPEATSEGTPHPNTVNIAPLTSDHVAIRSPSNAGPHRVHVIQVIEDRIDTLRSVEAVAATNGRLSADPSRDIAKIVVVERHHGTGRVGVGFVHGFGLKRGAIASTVGHDAHNLVAAGVGDDDICLAAEHLARIGGGFCAAADGRIVADVGLPIAGLMSDIPATQLSRQLSHLHESVRALGGTLRRPFMAMSFLTLSVIGKLKLTDLGLVDVGEFSVIDVLAD